MPPSPPHTYPFAASPDIIRSNQKDAYFQGVLLTRLSSILRQLYGARFAHNYTSEARVFSELLYLGLTTLVGNRTLGEEYCDIVQVEEDTLQLPAVSRRAGYILASIILPYGLNRILPAFRRRVRAKLEANLRRSSRSQTGQKQPRKSRLYHLQSYILANLDTLTSTSPMHAVSLSVFYFSGAYYHLSKRLFHLRYIFSRQVEPSEQRVGYEVLGVLLVLQLAVQAWLHVSNTASGRIGSVANPENMIGGTAVLDHGVEVSLDPNAYSSNNALLLDSPEKQPDANSLERMTHTKVLPAETYRYHLTDNDVMGWISGRQARKCTLCLEELKDPSVTTCGHVFCWNCIGDWVREKPECPLCRQHVLIQHILPLRG
ncbi:hypothetical protein NA57DRAFT_39411 [Rhizodiscina lignyota]|uniref:RING-type E3 ubiquitin transferase n=1 Tax=Rhizodiscina lignyota TaxID=1504668 RepID=A0A9P4M955_9PEZI|nr:hypothetical protein NA57DRAFT_39411 [Rhizodiscina lignyota]